MVYNKPAVEVLLTKWLRCEGHIDRIWRTARILRLPVVVDRSMSVCVSVAPRAILLLSVSFFGRPRRLGCLSDMAMAVRKEVVLSGGKGAIEPRQ